MVPALQGNFPACLRWLESSLSRGPGHVVRAIKAAFGAEPTRVFTIEDLCARVYARADRIEKKHRVSLIRAAKRVLERGLAHDPHAFTRCSTAFLQ
jgi:hypothetical protein